MSARLGAEIRGMMMGVVRRWSVMTLLVASACGDDGAGPTPGSRRGIRFLAGNQVTDSVGMRLPSPLIVEVRDSSGALAPLGTVVRFEGVLNPNTGFEVAVASLTSSNFAQLASGTTDASGRTGAFVMLPPFPGAARLVVSVPTLGLQDTARFTAVTGGIATVRLEPRDTTVRAGRSFTVRATIRDRYSNILPQPPTWSVIGSASGATVSAAGVASAAAAGRYAVVATAGGVSDTMLFGAVPEATILAHDPDRGEIVTLSLDGSNRRRLTTVTDGGIGVRPRWLPGGATIVYSGYAEPFQTLFVMDTAGAPRRLFPTLPPSITHMADVAPSPDGSWIYFAAYNDNCATREYCLHRVRPDGTGVMFLSAVRLRPEQTLRPSPSPDGRRVALNTLLGGIARLRVIDLTSNTFLPLDIEGVFPQWAPTGNTIAYMEYDGSLSLVNSDGSGPRRLVPGNGSITGRAFTWSPDGAWILFNGPQGVTLVEVQSGTAIPHAPPGELVDTSWR